jgi:hypothetical protein
MGVLPHISTLFFRQLIALVNIMVTVVTERRYSPIVGFDTLTLAVTQLIAMARLCRTL